MKPFNDNIIDNIIREKILNIVDFAIHPELAQIKADEILKLFNVFYIIKHNLIMGKSKNIIMEIIESNLTEDDIVWLRKLQSESEHYFNETQKNVIHENCKKNTKNKRNTCKNH